MTSQLPPNKSMQDLMAQANDIASGPIPTPDQFAQQEGNHVITAPVQEEVQIIEQQVPVQQVPVQQVQQTRAHLPFPQQVVKTPRHTDSELQIDAIQNSDKKKDDEIPFLKHWVSTLVLFIILFIVMSVDFKSYVVEFVPIFTTPYLFPLVLASTIAFAVHIFKYMVSDKN